VHTRLSHRARCAHASKARQTHADAIPAAVAGASGEKLPENYSRRRPSLCRECRRTAAILRRGGGGGGGGGGGDGGGPLGKNVGLFSEFAASIPQAINLAYSYAI